jgi:hypothetical protein
MKPRDILLFQNAEQTVNVSVYFQNGTFWLTQKTIAELFQVERSVVTKHLNNIFKTEELDKDSVCAKIAHTAEDGKKYATNFYRLEAILSVGYRVNSVQATDFRKWASQTLNEFIIKGFVMDDERLKQGKHFGQDYFDELLDSFLELYSYPILRDKGKVTMLEAKLKAEGEFDKFRVIQDETYQSDFDKLIEKMKK